MAYDQTLPCDGACGLPGGESCPCAVIAILNGEQQTVEALAEQLGTSGSETHVQLLHAEIMGLARRLPGGMFVRA